MTALGLHKRQMFIKTSNVVSRDRNEAKVYCSNQYIYRTGGVLLKAQAGETGCKTVSYLVFRRGDTDRVGDDQRRHLLLDQADLCEGDDELRRAVSQMSVRRTAGIFKLTSVTHPKIFAWKQTWFSDT